ncbi:hypothetical protein KR200_002632 [Drosophila serrata]|nr:hypothetical protein KR200_002632 [Drosophila serrata]
MNRPEIFTLTSYCWFEIFKQIKINCEKTDSLKDRYNLVKYLDLINFAICLECITKAFKQWNPQLYDELDIENTFLNNSERINIDLSSRYEVVKRISQKDKDIFWKSFFNAIEENEKLQCVEISYEPKQFHPDHFDRFAALASALKDKKTLLFLQVQIQGYTFENVPELGNLRSLYLDVRMTTDDLIELCRSNPKLHYLEFKSTELYGRLSDIVPYCHNLEKLTFTLKPDVDAKEYAPIAKLPQIKKLRLYGQHQEGTLVDLFKGLKFSNLNEIFIPDIHLSKEETQALSEINSLGMIKSAFRYVSSIANLVKLPWLQYLSIKIDQSEQTELIESLIPLITRTSVEIVSDLYRFLILFTEEDGVLRLRFDLSKVMEDFLITQLIVSLCQRLNISHLILIGDFGSFLGQTMFCILASKKPQILQELMFLRDKPLNTEEANALGAIQSLKVIFCRFKHLKSMIASKVQQLNGLLEKAKRVDKIKTEEVELRFIHESNNKITLTLFFPGTEVDHSIFDSLKDLNNLRKVEIKGTLVDGSLGTLFKSLAFQNLQELQIPIVDPEELTALSQISSLKILSCGLYCSQNIEHLANLKQLESLTLTVHPKGSLEKLFQLLASKENQVLRHLNMQNIVLTTEEIFQVSRMKSLERLSLGRKFTKLNPWITENWLERRSCQKCLPSPESHINKPHNKIITTKCSQNLNEAEVVASKYSDFFLGYSSESASNWELLGDLPNLKELCLYTSFKVECLHNLLRKLCQSDHQKITKFSLTLHPERIDDNEESLYKTIEQIGFLQNLTDLYLENSEGYVLSDLLDFLQTSSILRSLMLNRTFIDYEESLKVGRIQNLEKLLVGFSNEDSFQVLTKLCELKDLHMISTHETIVDKIMPILRTCKKLKYIFLTHDLSRGYIDSLLEILKSVREPSTQGPLILKAQLIDSDFEVKVS